jgi:hypothetical protein
MMGVLAVVVGVLVVRFVLRRRRRMVARADSVMVSREDRSVSFARYPGRLRGGGLALILAPGTPAVDMSVPPVVGYGLVAVSVGCLSFWVAYRWSSR